MTSGNDNPNLDYPVFYEWSKEIGMEVSMFDTHIRFIQWNNNFCDGKIVDEDTILGDLNTL